MVSFPDANGGVGSVADMAARLHATLPTGWFPVSPPAPAQSSTPVLDGLLAGLGEAWTFCYGLLGFTLTQARVGTAAGGFLDMVSADFFGPLLPRRTGEPDDGFRRRIKAALVSQQGTRRDVVQAVSNVTSMQPTVCEPTRGLDCGGYGSPGAAGAGGGVGYGAPGFRYGSGLLDFQYLVDVGAYAAFAPGSISIRDSPASFVNADGLIQLVGPRVLRPSYQAGIVAGALLERRSFNMILDSRYWSGFAQSAAAGTGAAWIIDHSVPGVLPADPVMAVSCVAGTRVPGPSIDIASGSSAITGSLWIFLSPDPGFTKVELVMTGLNQPNGSVYASADMTRVGQWQRLSLSLQALAGSGKNLRMGLLLSSLEEVNPAVRTQCWQIEPGTTASSYIPTAGALGIRAQDDILDAGPVLDPASEFSVTDVLDAVAASIPAATIAWTAVSLPATGG